MKKIFSILFLIVFLFNIMGFYPVFLLRQLKLKNELSQIINQQIESGNLTLMSFDKDEIKSLEWIKKNEFRYRGEMYDIVLTEVREGDKFYFYCYPDKKEKQLFAQLEKHVIGNIADGVKNQKQEQNLLKILTKDFICIKYGIIGANFEVKFDFIPFDHHYQSIISGKLSPPPKMA